MSDTSDKRSAEFLKISGQFQLGALITEASHPVTANLSEVAKQDIAKALDLLFEVDTDVVAKYREFAGSGRAGAIADSVACALKSGGRLFFTGCGSTGRLSIQLVSIWRDFWQRQRHGAAPHSASAEDWEHRAFSLMAGGDYALIKSVEGFEDFAAFGRRQLEDLGVSNRDVVFAITEGGETSFVIGTAWKGVEAGAKVYFVYNNPDDVLRRRVERSRDVLDDARIEKINLTTGPMAITGSTRMQATTIQLCVLLTVLEMVTRELMNADQDRWGERPREPDSAATDGSRGRSPHRPNEAGIRSSADVPAQFLPALAEMHATLRSPEVLSQLAQLVALEESVYRAGGKNNYYADRFGIDVLTDTTERSPTYCTPPFRKFDDPTATESWAFLFLPHATPQAWEQILKRPPCCVEWTSEDVVGLVGEEKAARTNEIVRRISRAELMRFRVGRDGIRLRPLRTGDSAIGIISAAEGDSLLSSDGFCRVQLESAAQAGAKTGLICLGQKGEPEENREPFCILHSAFCISVSVPLPQTDFLLDGVTRVGLKLLLNGLSTCTMVRLGRVLGNFMVWVVPSNLKLIDRATRYVHKLTGLSYEESNRLLFQVIEHVEPRMKADQAYPPVVGLAVLRARHGLTNEAAEQRLAAEGQLVGGV